MRKLGGMDRVVVGVDVGGKEKGFHAVALRGRAFIEKFATCEAKHVVEWCHSRQALAVGVDAPCKWSFNGKARPCESELARLGITTFATPSYPKAQSHPFYSWMLNGAELFHLFAAHYRLFDGRRLAQSCICFETFPQAIACAMAGKTLSARNKRVDRRRLLKKEGIANDFLTNIDEVDAALCALSAHYLLAGRFKAYGEPAEGFIVVPSLIH
jgi:predicted nuclease with RNAse H fold